MKKENHKNIETKRKKNLEQIKFCLNYISVNRRYFYFVILLFFLLVFVAVVFPISEEMDKILRELLKNLIASIENLNTFNLIAHIFSNNFLVSLLSIFLGIFFCFIPIIIASVNGYILGYASKIIVEKIGIISLWKLFPHGIFELPAIFLSLGLGIKLGVALFLSLNESSSKRLVREIKNSAKVLFFIIIPLLVIAAIIEGILIKFV